jgi:hypothetical protein
MSKLIDMSDPDQRSGQYIRVLNANLCELCCIILNPGTDGMSTSLTYTSLNVDIEFLAFVLYLETSISGRNT